jgi:hypothetical protein
LKRVASAKRMSLEQPNGRAMQALAGVNLLPTRTHHFQPTITFCHDLWRCAVALPARDR